LLKYGEQRFWLSHTETDRADIVKVCSNAFRSSILSSGIKVWVVRSKTDIFSDKHAASILSLLAICFQADYLLVSFFGHKDGDNTFLRNVD
jgi:hypothetical protein